MDQRLRELHALLHAGRVAVDRLVALLLEAGVVQRRVRALHRLGARQARQLAGVGAQLDRAHPGEERLLLRHVADAIADLRRRASRASSPSTRASPSYGMRPSRHLSSVDLPAPLGPSRPMILPSIVRGRRSCERGDRAVALGQAARARSAPSPRHARLRRVTGTTPASIMSSRRAARLGDIDDAAAVAVRAAIVDPDLDRCGRSSGW